MVTIPPNIYLEGVQGKNQKKQTGFQLNKDPGDCGFPLKSIKKSPHPKPKSQHKGHCVSDTTENTKNIKKTKNTKNTNILNTMDFLPSSKNPYC